MNSFHANGKLLISGEYVVLDGALALAIPTKKGQFLQFEPTNHSILHWKSLDENKNLWLEVKFNPNDLEIIESTDIVKAEKLKTILKKAIELNNQPTLINGLITTQLEFPLEWGLGSSSTLISCIAQWLNIDPYELHFGVSNGSGYDIACAENSSSITYQVADKKPISTTINWNPSFHGSLFFVYLNRKQKSDIEVNRFINNTKNINTATTINNISEITSSIINCNQLLAFNSLIEEHEKIMSRLLNLPTIKESDFPDFNGSIKSLGAWGGDFILATGDNEERAYFKKKGFNTIIEFKDMVK